jgi:hypothetical protein
MWGCLGIVQVFQLFAVPRGSSGIFFFAIYLVIIYLLSKYSGDYLYTEHGRHWRNTCTVWQTLPKCNLQSSGKLCWEIVISLRVMMEKNTQGPHLSVLWSMGI